MSREKNINIDFDTVVARIKEHEHLQFDSDVAELLGLKKGAFAERKRRGSLPEDKLEVYCERLFINMNWLLTGQGSKFDIEIRDILPAEEENLCETNRGIFRISDMEKIFRLPSGGFYEWYEKYYGKKVEKTVKEKSLIAPPAASERIDEKLISLIEKLKLIYRDGGLKERAEVRGIIEEVYDQVIGAKKKPIEDGEQKKGAS